MAEEIKKEAFTEEELKEIRRRKRALKKKRLAKKKAREEKRMRALLEDEELATLVETPEERQERLYEKAKKKMGFAPHMYRRVDQADMYRQAADLFAKTAGYEQADELREECKTQADICHGLYVEETFELVKGQLEKAKTSTDCQKIRENLDAVRDFRDVSEQEQACARIEQQIAKKLREKKMLKIFAAGVVILVIIFVIIYVQQTGLLTMIEK